MVNNIADKITNVSKLSQNNLNETNNETKMPRKRYISPEKRQQIIDALRLL